MDASSGQRQHAEFPPDVAPGRGSRCHVSRYASTSPPPHDASTREPGFPRRFHSRAWQRGSRTNEYGAALSMPPAVSPCESAANPPIPNLSSRRRNTMASRDHRGTSRRLLDTSASSRRIPAAGRSRVYPRGGTRAANPARTAESASPSPNAARFQPFCGGTSRFGQGSRCTCGEQIRRTWAQTVSH